MKAMSTYDPKPDDGSARPVVTTAGLMCTALIALESLVMGLLLVFGAAKMAGVASQALDVTDDQVAAFQRMVVVLGAVGVAVGAVLVLGGVKLLAARRAWRVPVCVLLVLNAIFPNLVSARDAPIFALPALVGLAGVVFLALGPTSQWLARDRLAEDAASYLRRSGGSPRA